MSTKPRKATPKPIWSHCNECGQDTLHMVVKVVKRSRDYHDDRYTVTVGSNWRILQCGGCQEVAMSRIDWCSEDDPQDPYRPTYFPPRVSRRKPDWLSKHPELSDYLDLFEEIYAALPADSRILAMMGGRAVIDMAITKMAGGDHGSFALGLNTLEQARRLTQEERNLIEAAFDAGSAAMHRGHKPKVDDVNTVIDIVERVVHAEVLKKKAIELSDATPKRPPRKPKRKENKGRSSQ